MFCYVYIVCLVYLTLYFVLKQIVDYIMNVSQGVQEKLVRFLKYVSVRELVKFSSFR